MVYRQLAYSRENEFEADAGGLEWMMSSPFDAHASITSLKHLADSGRNYFQDSIAMKSLFGEDFQLNDSNRYSFKTGRQEEEVINTVDDDIYQSHPDTEKRYTALAEILEMAQEVVPEQNTGIQNRDAALFKRMRVIAGFEMVESAYRHSDYVSALFLSSTMLRKFPENNYLKMRFAQALYWVTYFDANKGLERLIQNDNVFQEEEQFVRLVSFIKKKSGTELKKLCYNHFKAQKEAMKGKEAFFVYFGMSSEMFLGKEASSFIYKDYLAKYPNGASREFVKTKVE